MRKTIWLILLFPLFILGCKEKNGDKLILKNYEAEYNYSAANNADVNVSLANEIFESKLKMIIVPLSKGSNDYALKVRLFVNENGKLDHVKFVELPEFIDEKAQREIAETLADFDYSKIFVNASKKKAAFDISVTGTDYFNGEAYFETLDEMPEPVGGVKAIFEKISYPEKAREAGIEGRVYVKAYIDETGKVVKTKILRGVGYGCDEAAVRAIESVKFIPGKQKGKPAKSVVVIPIVFRLQ